MGSRTSGFLPTVPRSSDTPLPWGSKWPTASAQTRTALIQKELTFWRGVHYISERLRLLCSSDQIPGSRGCCPAGGGRSRCWGKALRERGRCQRPFPCVTALAAGAGWDGTDCDTLSQACDRASVLLPTHTRLSSCRLAGSLKMEGASSASYGRGWVLGAVPSADDEELPTRFAGVSLCPDSCTFS